MFPILFEIGPITIHSYGVMLAAAFLVSTHLASKKAMALGIPESAVIDLGIVFLIAGVIGSRILYVLLNINYFTKYPQEIFMVQKGGLVFYGGFILAFIAGIIFALIKKISILDAGDLIAPFAALGHAIGRIGCFLNGCCYGKATDSFLGVRFPGMEEKVLPAQLFSSAGLFIIFLMLLYVQKKRAFKGQVLFSYLALYGIFRFLIEFLRGDLMSVAYGLTATQIISIAVAFLGATLYFVVRLPRPV